jgi:hypothetical protein
MKIKALLLLLLFPVILSAQNLLEETPLPIMIIQTDGQEIPDEPKITAQMGVIYNGPGNLNSINDPYNEYSGFIGIELRGQTSQSFPKKGFGIETRDSDGEDYDVPLLGFPEESDWVLHGPYSDKSLIRNGLAYNMASRVMEYAPRTRFIELIINDDYRGVYLLTERIKRDKNRIDVAKLNPDENEGDDLTGGYLLRHDKEPQEEQYGWISPYAPYQNAIQDTWFFYLYPKPEDISAQQKTYIKNWITNLENVLSSPYFADPVRGYRQYIDLGTFIDYMWVNELTKNIDAFRLSTYMYKDKDSKGGKLKMGPVWDFNLAFSNVDYCDGASAAGWVLDFNTVCPDDFWVIHFWWERLRQDPAFMQEASMRWETLRANQFSDEALFSLVDSLVGVVEPAVERNFERWPVLDEWIWPNNFVGGSYEAEVGYLKTWLEDRLKWMDENILNQATNTEEIFDEESAVRVFPNPAGASLNFVIRSEESGNGEIRIFDSLGRLIQSMDTGFLFKQEAQTIIWNRQLPEGLYYFSALQEGRLLQSGKIIVR